MKALHFHRRYNWGVFYRNHRRAFVLALIALVLAVVMPALARVDYRLRCGVVVSRGAIADELRWEHLTPPSGGDIVAYRLHEKIA